MTATPHLSMAERIRVAVFDAAPEPPEIVVEKLRTVLADLTEALGRGDAHGLPEAYRAARSALRHP